MAPQKRSLSHADNSDPDTDDVSRTAKKSKVGAAEPDGKDADGNPFWEVWPPSSHRGAILDANRSLDLEQEEGNAL